MLPCHTVGGCGSSCKSKAPDKPPATRSRLMKPSLTASSAPASTTCQSNSSMCRVHESQDPGCNLRLELEPAPDSRLKAARARRAVVHNNSDSMSILRWRDHRIPRGATHGSAPVIVTRTRCYVGTRDDLSSTLTLTAPQSLVQLGPPLLQRRFHLGHCAPPFL
jgi:hypothetical protein